MFEAHHSPLLPDEADATAIFGPQKGTIKFHQVMSCLWRICEAFTRVQADTNGGTSGRRTCLEAKSFSNLHHSSNGWDCRSTHTTSTALKVVSRPNRTYQHTLSWANCNPTAHSMRFVWVSFPTTWLSLFPQLLHLPVMNIAPWVIWTCPWVMLKKQNEHTLPVESFSKVPVPQSFQELWFQTTPWRGCSFNS